MNYNQKKTEEYHILLFDMTLVRWDSLIDSLDKIKWRFWWTSYIELSKITEPFKEYCLKS